MTRSYQYQRSFYASRDSNSRVSLTYYDEDEYVYEEVVSLQYEEYMTMSSTPPPPYEWQDSFAATPPPQPRHAFYQQKFRSEVQLRPQPNTLRKKRSAWMSTRELPKVQTAAPLPSGSTSQLALARQPAVSSEYPPPGPMVRAAACLDTVVDRLHDVLCRVEGSGRRENGLDSLTRELSLDEPRYVIASDVEARSAAARNKPERTRVAFINIQKSWMYANSRLPPHMMPYKAYLSTWQVYCKAAEASGSVYERPRAGERKDYIEADWRRGTKAMALKSVVQDHDKVIIIAIRGSQWNIIDWAVNFEVEPATPVGFLDEDNPCHAGFLEVARSMVGPVAARLRQLVEQDPSRHTSSLLFTGHSAGGAVASLLYLHMLSQKVESELTVFNGIFKRVHCVTFGVPPMSLLPMQNPAGHRYKRNQFVSFINEGDLIARADFAYMKSLARLYTASAPDVSTPANGKGLRQKMSRQVLKGQGAQPVRSSVPPIWPVSTATLSNAGKLVLLRERPGHRTKIEAVCTSDEQLRGGSSGVPVVFGDPVMHHMEVYERRIQNLAITSVTGKEIG